MDLLGNLIGPGLGILTDPGWGIDVTPDIKSIVSFTVMVSVSKWVVSDSL